VLVGTTEAAASSLQRLCHHHSLELSADDAGVEECSMSGGRQHLGVEASSGEAWGEVQSSHPAL
jgi:hypothetical protein